MKKFVVVLLILAMLLSISIAFAQAVDAKPVEAEAVPATPNETPSVAAGVLLYAIVSVVMWYVIDWIKEILLGHGLPDKLHKIILLVICVGIGLLLAFTFKVDAFVLVAALMGAVVPGTPAIEPSIVGYVFGGLLFASGSAVIHEISLKLNSFKDKPAD